MADLKDYIENDFLLDLVKSESKKLYEELKRNRLEVILIPAPYQIHSCHMIRAVNGQNPDWYRNLYAEDNKLKRNHTLKYLERISKGIFDLKSKYCLMLLELIIGRLNRFD